MGLGNMAILGILGILAFVILMAMLWCSRIQTVGPNEVLVISGTPNRMKDHGGEWQEVGFKVVKGGRSFVWPIFEKCERLSLELMTLEIQTPEVVTKLGVPILVDGVAQIKVKNDELSICTAAEQFLGKSKTEVMAIAHQTLEGHLRAILGTMEVEELISNREMFALEVQKISGQDLKNMGLGVVSFTIKDIRDKHEYLAALGKKAIAEAQRNAAMGQAMAQRDAEIKRAQATSEAIQESSIFNKTAQVTKMAAETEIAQAHRDYQMKQAEYQGSVNQKKADSDRAYDLEKFKIDQLVKEEEMQVAVIAKQKEIQIQQQEITRREHELVSTVERPAEAEKKRIELTASGEQFRLKATAEGEAEATKMRGYARADVERTEGQALADAQKAKGLAEAEIFKAKGLYDAEVVKARGLAEAETVKARGLAEAESRRAIGLAEAEAMEKKADAWKSYSDAAITQMFIDKLPEIVRAVSEPLSRTEKIVMISNGNDGVGPSRLSKEVIDVVTQVPPMLESVTGVNLKDLVERISRKSKGEEAATPTDTDKPPKPKKS